MFVDRVKIRVIAGDGGDGCVAFRREKHVPRGGPSGGNGGKGGDVILRVDNMMTTLLDFYYINTYKAKKGTAGGGSDKTGVHGDDLVISVPPGTTVKDADSGEIIADLTDGEFIVAQGGRGGRGNATFKSSANRAPRFATEGKPGETRNLLLELKIIADVGLVGAPNAGKSTLLSRISSAKPKIADYPFTTLEPNLGIVELDNIRRMVVCDIPGLIEEAHLGKGLGHEFLRHVERNLVLLLLVDLSGDPVADYTMIINELESYEDGILKTKPRILVGTKADIAEDDKKLTINDLGGIVISSVTGEGLRELLEVAHKIICELKVEALGDGDE
ncbi:MAG TPA: GTPase ObgE [candidate division Zixibacteria bacterium]|nr:GTPase ObgE [candidate division Zixibacteria bacterium]